MVIFPLAPDQTIAQMWSNGARGGGGCQSSVNHDHLIDTCYVCQAHAFNCVVNMLLVWGLFSSCRMRICSCWRKKNSMMLFTAFMLRKSTTTRHWMRNVVQKFLSGQNVQILLFIWTCRYNTVLQFNWLYAKVCWISIECSVGLEVKWNIHEPQFSQKLLISEHALRHKRLRSPWYWLVNSGGLNNSSTEHCRIACLPQSGLEEGKPFCTVQCYYSHWFNATVGRVFSDLPRPVAYHF